jgi:preprotein translocase subunit SecE
MDQQGQGIEPKRLVAIFYVAAAIFLGVFLEKVLGIVFSYARWNDPALFSDYRLTTVIGYAIALVVGVVCWKHPRLHGVAIEIAQELKKVTWPSFRETRAATLAVIVATFAAAVILGVFDFVWARLSNLIY